MLLTDEEHRQRQIHLDWTSEMAKLYIGGHMIYWYVAYTMAGHEKKVEDYLNRYFWDKPYKTIILLLEIIHRKPQRVSKDVKPMFPGYLIVESEVPSHEFFLDFKMAMNSSTHKIRLLSYGNTDEIAMREEERTAFLKLCNKEYCVEASIGIIVGTKIFIKEGPLIGYESIIKKIDRHKRYAIIELEMMGGTREVRLPLEIIEKVK